MSQDMVKAAQAAGLVPLQDMKQRILALRDTAREGFEEFDSKQITIPRARLLQGLSPEVQQNAKDFHSGMLINSITKEPLTQQFIPLKKFTSFVRFNPRKPTDPGYDKNFKPGEKIWASTDPEDARVKEETKWGPNGEAPLATTFMNYLCYFEGFTLPLVLSFSRTSYTAGKNFYTMALGFGGAMYSHKYMLEAIQQTNDMGTFYVLGVRHAGVCSPEEVEIAKLLYDDFAPSINTMKVDEPEPGSDG